jgi:tetratricopeptide (TPR) repeat protein
MIAEGWEGTHVSPHTVDVTLAEVKKSLGEYGGWIVRRPKEGYALEIPTSEDLVRKGWHYWNRRTREGFERGIDCFRDAIAQCPSDFQAHHGLSVCYLTLATFGMSPPRDMYPLFIEAHDRAVGLGGLTPELRCDRAYARLIFERRVREAEADLRQTIEEKPTLASAYVRSALAYASVGRLDDANGIVERGCEIDPLFPMLSVMAVAVRFWRRDFEAARAMAAAAVELHPYLQVGRAFYAQALEFSGRLEEAREQYQIGWLMSQDLPWMRALEGTCLGKMGRIDEGRAVCHWLEQLRSSEYVDAYYMAVLRNALGDRAGALDEIERAFEENSAWLYQIDIDSKMDAFRAEPRFERVRARVRSEAQEVGVARGSTKESRK